MTLMEENSKEHLAFILFLVALKFKSPADRFFNGNLSYFWGSLTVVYLIFEVP